MIPSSRRTHGLGDAARQHQWFRTEDSPLAAELLFADTSCTGGEAVGNKEPRSLRTCPGKTPPFALIILFFSILHCYNNVSRPVSLYWLTQRIHSEIQIFLEHDHASVLSSGKKVVLFLSFHVTHASMDFASWVWGMHSLQNTQICVDSSFLCLCVCEMSAGHVSVPGQLDHKAPVFAAPQEFAGSVKSLGAPCRSWLGVSPLFHLQAEAKDWWKRKAACPALASGCSLLTTSQRAAVPQVAHFVEMSSL